MLLFKVKCLPKVRVHTYHFSSTAMKVLRGLLPTVSGGGNGSHNEITDGGLGLGSPTCAGSKEKATPLTPVGHPRAGCGGALGMGARKPYTPCREAGGGSWSRVKGTRFGYRGMRLGVGPPRGWVKWGDPRAILSLRTRPFLLVPSLWLTRCRWR